MSAPGSARVALAVVLPILAILFGVVGAERHGARSRDFPFAIEAYDPRDLLRGHYLRFRLVVDEGAPLESCEQELATCCYCLRARGDEPPLASRARCDTAAARCDGSLPVAIAEHPMRFWIAEEGAAALESRLRDAMSRGTARVILAIDPGGAVRARALVLDDERIGETPAGPGEVDPAGADEPPPPP